MQIDGFRVAKSVTLVSWPVRHDLLSAEPFCLLSVLQAMDHAVELVPVTRGQAELRGHFRQLLLAELIPHRSGRTK
jgi:hypothetical protein